jgi:hypothetical protein
LHPLETGVELPMIDEPHRIEVEIDSTTVVLDVWVMTDEDWWVVAEQPTTQMYQPTRLHVMTRGLDPFERVAKTVEFVDARVPNAVAAEHINLEDTQVFATRSGQWAVRVSVMLIGSRTPRDNAPRVAYVVGTSFKCPSYTARFSINNYLATMSFTNFNPGRVVDGRWSLLQHSNPDAGPSDPGWRAKSLIESPTGSPPLTLTIDLGRREYLGRTLKMRFQPEFDAEYQSALDASEPDTDCGLRSEWVVSAR